MANNPSPDWRALKAAVPAALVEDLAKQLGAPWPLTQEPPTSTTGVNEAAVMHLLQALRADVILNVSPKVTGKWPQK